MVLNAFRDSLCPSRAAVETSGDNVIEFRQKILKRHRAYLRRWLEAGQPMGLLAGQIEPPALPQISGASEQIVVWVRENSAPAYLIYPKGCFWIAFDALQEHELGRFRSLPAALNAIRPVLPPA